MIRWDSKVDNCANSFLSLLSPLELFTAALADGLSLYFHDSKSPQVSRTLLSILADLNNGVAWMVSTRPPTSESSSPFSNPLVTVPKALLLLLLLNNYQDKCSICSFSLFILEAWDHRLYYNSYSFTIGVRWTDEGTL